MSASYRWRFTTNRITNGMRMRCHERYENFISKRKKERRRHKQVDLNVFPPSLMVQQLRISSNVGIPFLVFLLEKVCE